jgi:hypothetical protein
VAPFTFRSHGHYAFRRYIGRAFRNPNAPVIDAKTRGVAGAIVMLRGVNARQARPWDHPTVQVEVSSDELRVRQGDAVGVGFVRRGDAVEFVSFEPTLQTVRGRGAAFFGVPLAEAHRSAVRHFRGAGLVELSSGIGYYWMQGYLFVCDHPYIARTDAQGCFTIPDVPDGDYNLVCWMPNWQVQRKLREPEAGIVNRIDYFPPLEQECRITVHRGQQATTRFVVYQQLFEGVEP